MIDRNSSAYRPDIDGLRALAVLSVIAFHLGVPGLTGGFVGVDVFFVISGYLITGTLLADLDAGRFSIARFYERRIRRIFPALLVMLLVTSVIAALVVPPEELRGFPQSLLAAVFSISNIYFWRSAGYFRPEAKLVPLLHTWSLGVEEQFYIIFPLLLAVLSRYAPRKLRLNLAALTGIALLVAVLNTFKAPTSAFYLLPARAWELLLGSLLAARCIPEVTGPAIRNLLAIAGLILILAADLFYKETTVFPGLAALPPCVGAALLIATGGSQSTPVARALSLPQVVFAGQISYSLYLWHWPLIAFQSTDRILSLGGPHRIGNILLLPAILVTGYLSWRFVEQPFRRGPGKRSASLLFGFTAACVTACIVISVVFVKTDGLAWRYPARALAAGAWEAYNPEPLYRAGTCYLGRPGQKLDVEVCLRTEPGKRNYLLFGDSESAHLLAGLTEVFPGVHFLQANASGCKPLLGTAGTGYCRDLMDYMFHTWFPSHRPDAVVIAANWIAEDLPGITNTVAALKKQGQNVILVGPAFQYYQPLPRLLANAIRYGKSGIDPEDFNSSKAEVDAEMGQIAVTRWHVRYISLFRRMCPAGTCPLYAPDGAPFQCDLQHFMKSASVEVAERLRQSGDLP